VRLTERLSDTVHAARVLARSGVFAPERPDRLWHLAEAARHWGTTLGAAFAAGAARFEGRTAIVDERGAVSFAELDHRTDALARGLLATGVRPGDAVGVLCRNTRHFFDITGALAKVGADTVYLNTGFSAPQLRDVMAREHATVLVHDDEFTPTVHATGLQSTLLAWSDSPESREPGTRTLDDLIAAHATGARPDRPRRDSRTIILTSGTTGTPKGAARQQRARAATGVALLERIPYRTRETMVIAAPCFHSWGFGNSIAALLLGNTMVLERHFAPERALELIATYRAEVFVAVPIMLARVLDVPDNVRRAHDTSSLRLVPLSGSALPGDLATRFMDAFGDVIYNLYGSTEVGYVTIATPDDLRAAPSTAGRAPRGTEIRLVDADGLPVEEGASGRIFVRSGLVFDGYTDGGSKATLDDFTSTGDTGHFDADGRLFVDGRDDDMIVSGGENVFPGEIEDVIDQMPGVVDVAVVGVPDDEFGQRLKAFVVLESGASLDAEAVRARVRGELARFKVPRDVAFVDAIPRNATGKVLRKDLV
jgi:fatty-acyl-CoA synthase